MKTKNYFYLVGACLLTMTFAFTACDKDDGAEPSVYELSGEVEDRSLGYSAPGENGGSSGGQKGNYESGVVTAGEWCDLTNWAFWSKLMLGQEFADKSDYWEFFTDNRVPVVVTDSKGDAVAGVKVKLLSENNGKQTTVWETVTDNHGRAECWLGLFQKATAHADKLRISLNGDVMDGHPVVCPLDSLLQEVKVNKYVYNKAKAVAEQADIAFIVDATGSMCDEIDFLKSDLKDIVMNAKATRPGMTMRTAALFYRDEGDDYLTKPFTFTNDITKTVDFIDEQNADGGGDYPEAVHACCKTLTGGATPARRLPSSSSTRPRTTRRISFTRCKSRWNSAPSKASD